MTTPFTSYAQRDDVYNLVLSATAFAARPRPFDAVDITTGTIRLAAHGLSALDLVLLSAVSGGALPGGVSGFTYYSPVVVGSDLFQLQGVASFSSAGSGWGVTIDPGRRLDMHLAETAAVINQHLTAYDPPIAVDPITGLYPRILVGLNARMAGRQAVTSLQIDNPAFRVAVDRLFERADEDKVLLDEWKAGEPIRPTPADQDAQPDNAARAGSTRVAMPWNTGAI